MATFRATFLGSAFGEEVRNVLHVSHSGSATVDELAGSLRNAWQTNILAVISSAYTFQGVEVLNIADDSAIGYAAATTPNVGADTTAPLPSWICASVQLKTTRRGRAGTGRMGLGPIGEQYVTGNSLTGPGLAGFADGVNDFLDDIQDSGGAAAMSAVVVSFIKDGVERPVPLVSFVESATVNSLAGSRLSRHPNR